MPCCKEKTWCTAEAQVILKVDAVRKEQLPAERGLKGGWQLASPRAPLTAFCQVDVVPTSSSHRGARQVHSGWLHRLHLPVHGENGLGTRQRGFQLSGASLFMNRLPTRNRRSYAHSSYWLIALTLYSCTHSFFQSH